MELNNYTSLCEKHLKNFRHEAIRILLIGILNEKKVQFWSENFPLADIHIIDMNIYSIESKIHPIDVNNENILRNFASNNGIWDIIIVDNVNSVSAQTNCLLALWDYLKRGGYFIIGNLQYSLKTKDIKSNIYSFIESLRDNTYFNHFSSENNTRFLYGSELTEIYNNINENNDGLITSITKKRKFKKDLNFIENLVLITSVLDCSSTTSFFNRDERFEQTKYTIESIKAKIPNVFIAIIDASLLTENEKTYFDNNVDLLINCDKVKSVRDSVYSGNKSLGESNYLVYGLTALNNFLEVNEINSYKFKAFPNLKNIFKISGRYYLDSSFNFLEYDSLDNVIQIVDPNKWMYKAVSCFYKVSTKYINDFVLFLKLFIPNFLDQQMEDCIFQYILYNRSTLKNIHLGVSGRIGPNGILGST